MLGLTLLFPPEFSEERDFLRVDWDCSLTFGDFNWHILPHGLQWKLILVPWDGWPQEFLVSNPALSWDWKPRRVAQVGVVLSSLWKGIELLVVRNAAKDFCPPSSWHWAGRGAVCSWHELDLDIGILVWKKQHNTKCNCSCLWAISVFRVGYMPRN